MFNPACRITAYYNWSSYHIKLFLILLVIAAIYGIFSGSHIIYV